MKCVKRVNPPIFYSFMFPTTDISGAVRNFIDRNKVVGDSFLSWQLTAHTLNITVNPPICGVFY